MKPYLNRTVREIAAERGKEPFGTMLDLALADGLQLKLLGALFNNNRDYLRKHVRDRRVLIGAGDGGAHVDMLFECGYPTYMFGDIGFGSSGS